MKIKVILVLLFLFVISLAVPTVSAQTMEKEKQATSASEVATESPSTMNSGPNGAKTEYQLPYPGLLPDHPLYILKTIRDRIVDMLIADPVEKTRFYITSADKRLAASIALVDKGKPELAESTASKGEEYLAKAVAARRQAKREGKDISSITTKLTNSLNKHESALLDLATKTSGGIKDRFTEMSANAGQYRQSL